MKKYELMTIYPLDDEKSKKGADDVKSTLAKFGAEIEEEKPFGDRDRRPSKPRSRSPWAKDNEKN